LYDFTGTANGSSPWGSLILEGNFLYGMTYNGGANSSGTIFKIKPDGTGYSNLHSFQNSPSTDARNPWGSLISDGIYLYGMTSSGGIYNLGTIFKIKMDGTGFTKLRDFAGVYNGSFPWGDGSYPKGDLLSDGTYLYGMTSAGGTNDDGIIFKIKPDGTGFTKLLDFDNNNGKNPGGNLIYDGTYLYGMTNSGSVYGEGLIFKLKPDGSNYSNLYEFSFSTNGVHPHGSLLLNSNYLFGTTIYGGNPNDYGVLFKIKKDGSDFIKMHEFESVPDGSHPNASLVSDGAFLYGTTSGGGSNGVYGIGSLFKIKTDSTEYSKFYDCDSIKGSYPNGSLLFSGNFLYGMTSQGGTNNMGTIFKYGIVAGINEYDLSNTVNIYPNPNNGVFNVQMNRLENFQMKISNVLGENVYESQSSSYKEEHSNWTVDLSNQPNGVYLVNLKTQQGISAKKIIINR
jgi:uncharacterized repeat protein (TIGR03803 family)